MSQYGSAGNLGSLRDQTASPAYSTLGKHSVSLLSSVLNNRYILVFDENVVFWPAGAAGSCVKALIVPRKHPDCREIKNCFRITTIDLKHKDTLKLELNVKNLPLMTVALEVLVIVPAAE